MKTTELKLSPEIASFEAYVRRLQSERGLSYREAFDTAQREQPHLYAVMEKASAPLTPHLGLDHGFNAIALNPDGTIKATANAAGAAMDVKVRQLMGPATSYAQAWDLCMANPENAELVRAMRGSAQVNVA